MAKAARSLVLMISALALLAAQPAAAPAQSLDEAGCRETTGLHSSCVGVMKLAERVSAECRRARVLDDERCWTGVGRRVVRSEVDAHQESWLQRTLAFQYELGNDLPMRNAPWIGTHNSFNDLAEEPTLSHTDSNQQLGLADQLRLDVRSLELDVHWIPSPRAGGASAPVLCHGRGADQAHAGCTTERLLSERLGEVAEWVRDNRDQVLLLYIEDHIGAAGYAATAKVVSDAFGEALYRPRAAGCNTLPLELTRAEVLAAGRQVVIVGGCGSGAWTGVSHSWPSSVRFEARPVGYKPFPDCGPPSPSDAASRIVRYFEDSTFVAPAAAPTGFSSTDDGLTPATVRQMVRCGVDIFGFDQLLPRDGRLAALAWSWAEGEPAAAPVTRCAAQRADGRWEARPCAQKHRPACRSGAGGWTVLPDRVRHDDAPAACAASGLAFATPRSGNENELLRVAAGERDIVWIAHRVAPRSHPGQGARSGASAHKGRRAAKRSRRAASGRSR